MKKDLLFGLVISLVTLSSPGLAEWSRMVQISDTETKSDAYPVIGTDDQLQMFDRHQCYGRAHIAWTATTANGWRTLYRVLNSPDNSIKLSKILEVDKEEQRIHSSDIPTMPSIQVDPSDDRADIAFCQQKLSWYYPGVVPLGCLPAREILFRWKPEVFFGQNEIEPPAHLHHVSGLQKGITNPFLLNLKFKPVVSYENILFWSQVNRANTIGDYSQSIYYNYQRHAKMEAVQHIDWGDIRHACLVDDEQSKLGDFPYAAATFDKTVSPHENGQGYILAVVNEKSDEQCIELSYSTVTDPDNENPFGWNHITIPGSNSGILPVCAFEHPQDPYSKKPILKIVYLRNWPQYPEYVSIDFNLSTLRFSLSKIVDRGSKNYASRPAIAISESNDCWIAYINKSSEVSITKNFTPPTMITSPVDIYTHSWVSLAIDDVSLTNGCLPQVVFTGSPLTGNNMKIFYSRYLN